MVTTVLRFNRHPVVGSYKAMTPAHYGQHTVEWLQRLNVEIDAVTDTKVAAFTLEKMEDGPDILASVTKAYEIDITLVPGETMWFEHESGVFFVAASVP